MCILEVILVLLIFIIFRLALMLCIIEIAKFSYHFQYQLPAVPEYIPQPAPEQFFAPPAEYEVPQNSYRHDHNHLRHMSARYFEFKLFIIQIAEFHFHSNILCSLYRTGEQEEEMQLGAAYSPPPPNPEPSYPPVQCPHNLLISCQPSLQQAPCASNYPAEPPPSPVKPAYRFANEDEEEPFVGQSQQMQLQQQLQQQWQQHWQQQMK